MLQTNSDVSDVVGPVHSSLMFDLDILFLFMQLQFLLAISGTISIDLYYPYGIYIIRF